MSGNSDTALMLRAIDARMHRALRPARVIMAFLMILFILMAAVVANNFYVNVRSCENGNAYRAGNIKVWDHVLDEFTVGPNVNPQTMLFVDESEQFVSQVNAPHSCGVFNLFGS